MATTGTTAKALRKNTTCPTGTASPSQRIIADISANSSAEAILSRMPLGCPLTAELPPIGGRRRITEGRGIDHVAATAGTPMAAFHPAIAAWRTAGSEGPQACIPLFLLGLFRALDRRQGFDIGGHRSTVFIRELRGVRTHKPAIDEPTESPSGSVPVLSR